MGDLNELVERLRDWLVERGLPDSGIRYEGPYSGDGVRRRARVELHGEDATFVASHFHGSGATQLAAALTSLIAERDGLLPEVEHFFDPRDVSEPAAVLALALRMAVDRGGQTCPVSSYDITNAREQITGEVKEVDRLRRELRTAEAQLKEAREALTEIASGKDEDGNTVDFFQDIAGEALAALSLDTNKGDGV